MCTGVIIIHVAKRWVLGLKLNQFRLVFCELYYSIENIQFATLQIFFLQLLGKLFNVTFLCSKTLNFKVQFHHFKRRLCLSTERAKWALSNVHRQHRRKLTL